MPTGSSVHFRESVRSIVYPGLSFNESSSKLNDWCRLFLVHSAAHCAANSDQENGLFPQTNFAVMIDWVESDIVPTTLNARHTAGAYIGQNAQICAWPLRPPRTDNGTTQNFVFDQASFATWAYDFSAYKLPLY